MKSVEGREPELLISTKPFELLWHGQSKGKFRFDQGISRSSLGPEEQARYLSHALLPEPFQDFNFRIGHLSACY